MKARLGMLSNEAEDTCLGVQGRGGGGFGAGSCSAQDAQTPGKGSGDDCWK